MPDVKTDCDGRMEMTARYWAKYYDGEDDTDGIGPTNLEERAKRRIRFVGEEGGGRSNTGITTIPLTIIGNTATKVGHTRRRKHTSFSGHLTKPAWTPVLKVQPPLGDRWRSHNVTGDVTLQSLRHTSLHFLSVKAVRLHIDWPQSPPRHERHRWMEGV